MPAELTILTTLAQALGKPGPLADALDAALGTVAQVLGLETGWVWLLAEDDPEPRLAAARALPDSLRDHPGAMHGDCYCLRTFREGDLRGAANVNFVRCSRLAQLIEDDEDAGDVAGLRCHASIPLAVGERRLGMLNVADRNWRVLDEDELNLLTTVGALVSLVIERSRLEQAGARAIAAEERNRIAREIHDTLAQGLAALTMQLETADALAASTASGPLGDAVARALALAQDTLAEARRSVLDLRTSPLEDRTLPQALEDLARETRAAARGGLEVRLRLDGLAAASADLPVALEVGIYRIAQQALANVLRHAHAARVTLRLERAAERLRLVVEDDGDGFEPEHTPPNRFGLVGMGERARLMGGRMTIETSLGVGTTVNVEVPLRPGAARVEGG